MRSGLLRPAGVIVAVLVVWLGTTASGAASQNRDTAIARAGTFVASDFPAGFQVKPASSSTTVENLRLAQGVAGCGPYTTLQKQVLGLPQAKSSRFADSTRTIGNDVEVFPSARAASAALHLYAKPSVVGCLEALAEKQLRQDPDVRDRVDDVTASLHRQDIAGLGDDSVVYEGTIVITATDGSTSQVGVGRAAVQVGRAVDVVSYTTTEDDLTDVVAPAIDASSTRLRAALGRSSITKA